MRKMIALAIAALAPVAAFAQVSEWKIDPNHSHASFSIRHLGISNVRGEFQKLSGTVKLDEKDVAKSSVEATIDATSIDTRQPQRDADLRSANFFDVEKYPTITFKSTKVEKTGDGKLAVTGDLTMHGTTKPVVLQVEGPTAAIKDAQGNARRGISATTKINRREFGLNFSAMVEAGPVVGDEAQIELAAELVKEPGDVTAQGKAEDKAAGAAPKAESKAEPKAAKAKPAGK
ncbi:MAG TPA: YceI family protein [Anaeromyxobacteraceae bacterium]|nr:YceI family protein [Anaeromyxobacteraceae bacterium]